MIMTITELGLRDKMSTKSSIMYDEESDIHVYREMLDDCFYISCGISEMKLDDPHLIIELNEAYDKVHHVKKNHERKV